MKKTVPFMDVPGSDPSAAMKGDNAQFVKGGTGPNSKPKPPRKVGKGGYVGGVSQFNLPRDRQRRTQKK